MPLLAQKAIPARDLLNAPSIEITDNYL